MNCMKIRSLFGPYIDSELTVDQGKEVEQHIKDCHACREELDVMRKVEQLCKAGELPALPEHYFNTFTARLHQRILSEGIKRENVFFLFKPGFLKFALAFSVVFLLALSVVISPRMMVKPETGETAVMTPVVYYASSDKDARVKNYLTNSEIVLIQLASMPASREHLELLKQTVSQSGLKEQIDSNMHIFKDNPELLKHAKAMEIVSIKILNTQDSDNHEELELLRRQVQQSGLLQKTQSMKI